MQTLSALSTIVETFLAVLLFTRQALLFAVLVKEIVACLALSAVYLFGTGLAVFDMTVLYGAFVPDQVNL
jgi:hypothetical protein